MNNTNYQKYEQLTLIPSDPLSEALPEIDSKEESLPLEITCSHCFSINYQKNGFTKDGYQKFNCKDCNRTFQINYKSKRINYESKRKKPCPHCFSTNYRKVGFSGKARKQRYSCNNCHKSFQFDYEPKRENNEELPDCCPRCASTKYTRAGLDKKKRQLYKCFDCTRVFTRDSEKIYCPECSNTYCVKAGFKNRKQSYLCRNCNREFVFDSDWQRREYPKKFNFDDDVWLAEHLRLKIPIQHAEYSLNYFSLKQEDLKYYVKKFVLYQSNTRAWRTLQHYITTFKDFSKFLNEIGYCANIQEISRDLILDYISYLNRKNIGCESIKQRLGTLSTFFKTASMNGWFETQRHLIRAEDYPKRKKPLPRYIPEEVMTQLNQYLDKLPGPIMRMVLVIQECGLRIGELCTLPFDCLKKDGENQYRIQFMRHKMKTEGTIPISVELAKVIKEQQQQKEFIT